MTYESQITHRPSPAPSAHRVSQSVTHSYVGAPPRVHLPQRRPIAGDGARNEPGQPQAAVVRPRRSPPPTHAPMPGCLRHIMRSGSGRATRPVRGATTRQGRNAACLRTMLRHGARTGRRGRPTGQGGDGEDVPRAARRECALLEGTNFANMPTPRGARMEGDGTAESAALETASVFVMPQTRDGQGKPQWMTPPRRDSARPPPRHPDASPARGETGSTGRGERGAGGG